jgi:hypothetical protein
MGVEIVGSVDQEKIAIVYVFMFCGDVTVTVQTFNVTIIRDIRTCTRIQLTQNIVLLQSIPTQSHD